MRVAQGASTYLIKSSGASSELSFGAKTGIVAIKTGDIEVAHRCARPHDALRQRPSRRALRLGARRAEGRRCRRTSSTATIVFVGTSAIGLKDLRSTPVDDAAPGRRGPCPARRADAEQDFLARPDFADGAEFLYLAVIGAAVRPAAAAAVGRPDGDRRGDLHRHRPGRAVARLLANTTCCSTRSIRRSRWRRSMSAARRSPSCAPSASARRSAAPSASTCRPTRSSGSRAIPNCCSSAASSARSP